MGLSPRGRFCDSSVDSRCHRNSTPHAHLPYHICSPQRNARQALVGVRLKCPVRRAAGKPSRQRTQDVRAAEADARLYRGATALGMGCGGDRSSPWDGSGRGRPIRCCRSPCIGASACLRKTSGGSGGRATRPAGNRAGLDRPMPTLSLCRRTPATRRQPLGPGPCVVGSGMPHRSFLKADI